MRLGETISLKINICNCIDYSCVLLMDMEMKGGEESAAT
jgi:hypothetical protein